MAIKKGDLVKVIDAVGLDKELFGIKNGVTYEVLYFDNDGTGVFINAGNNDRLMYYTQVKKVKGKSKKDLRIEELESIIKQISNLIQ